MKVYTDILFATLIVVYIIDLSGFTQSWRSALAKWLKVGRVGSIRPFDCSLCMVWWVGLVIAICDSALSFGVVAYIAALSFLADCIGMTFNIAKAGIKKALAILFNALQ